MNEIFQRTSGEMENVRKNQGTIFYVVANMQDARNSTKTSDESEQNWLQEWH